MTKSGVAQHFVAGVDSIKVEVSTKVGGTRSVILKKNGEAVIYTADKSDITLPDSTAHELLSLADSLFVEKTKDIILSKEAANGRTGYPIFTVTLYHGGDGEITRYDLGTQEGNITHCTTCDIHYSIEFRHFANQVIDILGQ